MVFATISMYHNSSTSEIYLPTRNAHSPTPETAISGSSDRTTEYLAPVSMMNDGESASICEYYPDKKKRNTINGRYQQYHADTRNEGKKTSKRTSEESRNTFEDDTPYSGATSTTLNTSTTQFTTRNSTNTEMGENYYNGSRNNELNDGTTSSRRDKSSESYNQGGSNYDANPYSNIDPEPYHRAEENCNNKSWCHEDYGAAIASNDPAKSNPTSSTMLPFNNHHEHHTVHRDDRNPAATGTTSPSVTRPTCYDAAKQSGAVTNYCRSVKENHRPHHHQEQQQQQPYGHYNYHAPPPPGACYSAPRAFPSYHVSGEPQDKNHHSNTAENADSPANGCRHDECSSSWDANVFSQPHQHQYQDHCNQYQQQHQQHASYYYNNCAPYSYYVYNYDNHSALNTPFWNWNQPPDGTNQNKRSFYEYESASSINDHASGIDHIKAETMPHTNCRPTRKRTKKRPDDMPRYPLSAYNFFFSEEREVILAVLSLLPSEGPSRNDCEPDIPVCGSDTTTTCTSSSTEEGQGSFKDEAMEAKPKFQNQEKEMHYIKATLSNHKMPEKEMEKLQKKIKANTQRMLDTHLEGGKMKKSHKKTHGKITFQVLSKLIGQRWREISDAGDAKQYYLDLAKNDMDRYIKHMENYEKLAM